MTFVIARSPRGEDGARGGVIAVDFPFGLAAFPFGSGIFIESAVPSVESTTTSFGAVGQTM
jgi:hypothetical protein